MVTVREAYQTAEQNTPALGQRSPVKDTAIAHDRDGGPLARWANAPDSRTFRHTPYHVLLETGYKTDEFDIVQKLLPADVTVRCDGQDSTATFIVDLNWEDLIAGGQPAPGGIGDVHFTDWLERMVTDKRIIVREVEGNAQVLFCGYVETASIRWDKVRQRVTVMARSLADIQLSQHPDSMVWGRWMRRKPYEEWDIDAPDVEFVDSLPCHFNTGGKPNRSADPITTTKPLGDEEEGEPVDTEVSLYTFTYDGDPTAEYWTVGQALAYLIHNYIDAQDIDVIRFWWDLMPFQDEGYLHDPEDTDQFRKRLTMRCDDIRLDATDLGAALVTICTQHGLHVDVPIIKRGQRQGAGSGESPTTAADFFFSLRIWPMADNAIGTTGSQMGRAEKFDWPRDPPWETWGGAPPSDKLMAQQNPGETAAFTVDHRATNEVIALDSPKLYEVTMHLRPGWIPWIMANAGDYHADAQPPAFAVLDEVTAITATIQAYWLDLIDPATDEDDQPVVRSIHDSAHPDHKHVADLGRVWIFPTDSRRTDPKWQRTYPLPGWLGWDEYSPISQSLDINVLAITDPYGCALAAAAPWVSRSRPLGYPISQTHDSGRLPLRLEMKFKDDDEWTPFPGVKITSLDNECGIRISHPNLARLYWPGWEDNQHFDPVKNVGEWCEGKEQPNKSFLNAILNRTLRMRVTGTIQGDRRLIAWRWSTSGFARPASRIIDCGGRFTFRDRASGNSVLRSLEYDDPEFLSLNQTEQLEALAASEAELAAQQQISGNPSVWWIEPTLRLGDQCEGLAGLGVTFPQAAEIVTLVHTFRPGRTAVHFADVRFDAGIEQGGLV